MGVTSALEAGTYFLMGWTYDHPVSLAAQVLISARALSAPLLAPYLSLAKPLPVTAADLLGQVELASGRGLLSDVVAVANGQAISLAGLEQKIRLYGASAILTPEDRTRLDHMIQAVMQSNGAVGQSTHAQEAQQYVRISESKSTRLVA
jgi:hypothetical protein